MRQRHLIDQNVKLQKQIEPNKIIVQNSNHNIRMVTNCGIRGYMSTKNGFVQKLTLCNCGFMITKQRKLHNF